MDVAPVTAAGRWPADHVSALAPDASVAGAARRIAVPGQWFGVGADSDAVWGLYRGGGAEPYQTAVELAEPAFRCSCPSRKRPCKHTIALLLLWSGGHVGESPRPSFVAEWLGRRAASAASAAEADRARREADVDEPTPAGESVRRPRSLAHNDDGRGPLERAGPADRRAVERAARVGAGLTELDRWLSDCVRSGLTAPALAQYSTWDTVAARVVDAQAPSLANRLRRLAGAVGTRPGWHEHVLAEIGVLHLLCSAGRRLGSLDESLADSARSSLGWTVRQADVLARAPETGRWFVAGRSDTLEDRIVVRRTWLHGLQSRRWALLLSFAAYGQSLSDALGTGAAGDVGVGSWLDGDVHRYPGLGELRCVPNGLTLVAGERPPAMSTSLAGASAEVGAALGAVPWIERWPVTVRAAPARHNGQWVITDHTGSLPLVTQAPGLAAVVAVSGGAEVALTCEWTNEGLIPLAVHLDDRSIDVGPRGGFHERTWRAWNR
jgi:hypothetical protein